MSSKLELTHNQIMERRISDRRMVEVAAEERIALTPESKIRRIADMKLYEVAKSHSVRARDAYLIRKSARLYIISRWRKEDDDYEGIY